MAVTASAALGACVLVALPLIGLVAHADDSTLARGSASGTSVASARATVKGPRGLSTRVESSPDQRVTGKLNAVCTVGAGEVRLVKSFEGQSPLDLAIPLTVAPSAMCIISATAKGTRGRVTVALRGE